MTRVDLDGKDWDDIKSFFIGLGHGLIKHDPNKATVDQSYTTTIVKPFKDNSPRRVGSGVYEAGYTAGEIVALITEAIAFGAGAASKEVARETGKATINFIEKHLEKEVALNVTKEVAKEGIQLSKKTFGHTFTTHGADMTKFLIKRAEGSMMPQGQFLDNQKAAQFILDNMSKTVNGAVNIPMPNGFPARVIMPDGTYKVATHIRIVPSGSGAKTAYPLIP